MTRRSAEQLSHRARRKRWHFAMPPTERPRFFEPDERQWWRNGDQPKRDSQRQKCYDSERELVRSGAVDHRKRFDTVLHAVHYVEALMDSKWFQSRFPYFETCFVENVPGMRNAWAWPMTHVGPSWRRDVTCGKIQVSKRLLADWGELIILHELAHAVIPKGHQHDRRWARVYLEFVGRKLGRDAKRALQEQYRKHRVKCSPVARNRGADPERLRQLRESRSG